MMRHYTVYRSVASFLKLSPSMIASFLKLSPHAERAIDSVWKLIIIYHSLTIDGTSALMATCHRLASLQWVFLVPLGRALVDYSSLKVTISLSLYKLFWYIKCMIMMIMITLNFFLSAHYCTWLVMRGEERMAGRSPFCTTGIGRWLFSVLTTYVG